MSVTGLPQLGLIIVITSIILGAAIRLAFTLHRGPRRHIRWSLLCDGVGHDTTMLPVWVTSSLSLCEEEVAGTKVEGGIGSRKCFTSH